VAITRFHLPIRIIDVEYQFDRRQLTVFYSIKSAHQRAVDHFELGKYLREKYGVHVVMVVE
jgi:cell fate regulator YaaT (PSP1 superfamily)